ncbi:MAG TPA: hypothetical protein VHB01_13660 [Nitrosospira sp.]|nr:hypothetical protein [Nitrosospira sp.]
MTTQKRDHSICRNKTCAPVPDLGMHAANGTGFLDEVEQMREQG